VRAVESDAIEIMKLRWSGNGIQLEREGVGVGHAKHEVTRINMPIRRYSGASVVLQDAYDQENPLIQGVLWRFEEGSRTVLQARSGIFHAIQDVTLFLTVTLITALLIGWFQVVCFLHKFSLARVRPRSLRQYREHAHCLSAVGDAKEQVI
jgi:hypothetical protein